MAILEKIAYILLAIVILLIMVIIHEFGHYIAGKLLKFKINEFAIGFGPKLLSKKRKNGEIISLRLIPLGGFCAFEGEGDYVQEQKPMDKTEPFEELNASRNDAIASELVVTPTVSNNSGLMPFNKQPPWKRIIVLIAGAGFNLISAFLFSLIVLLVVGTAMPKINDVYANPQGEWYSALQKGDIIRKVEGEKINILSSFDEIMLKHENQPLVNFTVERDGKLVDIEVKRQGISLEGKESYIGFGFGREQYFERDVGSAFAYFIPYTFKLSWMILGTFGKLITGQIPITSLTGPIGTVDQIASVSAMNWRNILVLLPLLASNLAIFNLLPIPALDGSKVVFTVIEWIRKKPINPKVEAIIHFVGLIALFGFVIIVDLIGLLF